jgi:hypothetical protein
MELELGQAKSHKDTESVIGRFLKSKDIEKAILSIDGVFSAKDVPAAVEKMFPGKIHYGKSVIPNALIKLERANKLEYVERRSGQTPATYRRIGKGKN